MGVGNVLRLRDYGVLLVILEFMGAVWIILFKNIWAIIGVVLAIIAVAYQALQFHKGRKARVRQQIISGNNNRQSAHKDGDTEQRIEGGSHNVQDIQ